MPQFVAMIRIDWHVAATPRELHGVLGEANAALDSTDHTITTFTEQLARVAREHPQLVADILVDDGYRKYALYRLENGVHALPLDERLEDAPTEAIDLPYDGAPSADIPLAYSDLDELHEILDDAATEIDEPERFLVEVGFDRYLVELAPGETRTRKLGFAGPHASLAARLVRGDYPAPPSPPRDPTEKHAATLFWPASMLQFIQDEATRCDKSMSWIVQFAWKTAYATIAAADADAIRRARQHFDGETQRQTLYYPGAMLDQIEAQATRLDVSQSSVAQAAVSLARGDITKLPAG